ncbi:MAG: hypothetical protein WD278_01210 [Pirellulales bacterium]
MPDRERAKQIIAEIVRVCGTCPSKTTLYKAFYFAHLYYAKREPGYLSDWPIVKMPFGPGIDQGDELLDELTRADVLRPKTCSVGPFVAVQYSAACPGVPESLSLEAISAIREAVDFVKDKSAGELTALTHEFSRSWNEAAFGEELNLYADISPQEVYDRRARTSERLDTALAASWPTEH